MSEGISAPQNLNGHVKGTETTICIRTIRIDLDFDTAWALCNCMNLPFQLGAASACLETDQKEAIRNLRIALGAMLDYKFTLERKEPSE